MCFQIKPLKWKPRKDQWKKNCTFLRRVSVLIFDLKLLVITLCLYIHIQYQNWSTWTRSREMKKHRNVLYKFTKKHKTLYQPIKVLHHACLIWACLQANTRLPYVSGSAVELLQLGVGPKAAANWCGSHRQPPAWGLFIWALKPVHRKPSKTPTFASEAADITGNIKMLCHISILKWKLDHLHSRALTLTLFPFPASLS